jgi:hypothetical protein
MTKPDFGACEVRFLLPDIRLERRHVRPERISLLYFLSGRHSRFDLQKRCRYASSRTYRRQDMPGCPNYAHQMPLLASLEGGWNTYAAVSKSEVICDLRCGGKANERTCGLPL